MLKYYSKRVLLFLVVSFATLEIGLQIASIVLPALLVRSDDGQVQAYDLTVLCVGDSHTFGAPLPAQDAYPAQLDERLNATSANRRVRVVNLGIPGQNSAMVANRLEKQINYYQPDLVIAWIGLNNSWNFNEFDLEQVEDPFIGWRQWILRSRVIRLIVVSGFREVGGRPSRATKPESGVAPGGVQQWRLGDEVVEIPTSPREAGAPTENAIQTQRQIDYSRIISLTKAYTVPLIFLTYPLEILDNQRATNVAIRNEAERNGISVVASSDAFHRAVQAGHESRELIVDAVGPHPTRVLYQYLVDQLAPMVDRVLPESSPGG
jgi:hypothetical protein